MQTAKARAPKCTVFSVTRYALCLVLFCSGAASAQMPPRTDSTATQAALHWTLGAMAIGVLTRAAPAYDGRTFTELQLTQPMLAVGLSRNQFAFHAIANAEGYTLRRGELNAGIYGEGYLDRRHPHTLVHEAMLTWMPRRPRENSPNTSWSLSLSAGRGFVPFGSDDPMMRPLEKYPVNHHHAQIIERIQGVLAARVTRRSQSFGVEFSTFNGDEPAGPFHGPRWNRVGDSWAIRGTLQPVRPIEISLSEARVKSPELQQGGAFDHQQRHASLRFERPSRSGARTRYLLAEWAETDERTNGQSAFRFHSVLVEGMYGFRGANAVARIERTERGEQSRLADPFRAPVGHVDFQILGVTQWTVVTVGIQAPSLVRRWTSSRLVPFLEVARATPVSRRRPTAFEPSAFYGADELWSVSAGLRVHTGAMQHRMGRYGVMRGSEHTGTHQHEM